MAIDRSKFKGSSINKMKQKDQELNKSLGKDQGDRNMLKIEEGKNIFRIYPSHNPEEVYAEPVVRVFLPMMVVERDREGKEIIGEDGKKKMKESARPIFNSRIHGDTEKDLVEEYINLARKIAEEELKDKSKKSEFLDNLYGKYVKGNPNAPKGIKYKPLWQVYADKIEDGGKKKTFGRLEFGTSVKERLNKIASTEAGDEGDTMAVDPFTHPDDGRAIVINYNKQATKSTDYYTTDLDSSFDRVTKQITLYPLSEEQWEHWSKQVPLEKMFRGVFKKSDYELQFAGLQFFDKKYKMGIFGRAEWEEIVEEIQAYYSDDVATEPEEKPAPSNKPSSTPTPQNEEPDELEEEEEEEEEEDDTRKADKFDLMERAELKNYIKTKELGIAIKPSMTEEVIRTKIREVEATIEEIKQDTPPPAAGGRSRLDRFRKEEGNDLPF